MRPWSAGLAMMVVLAGGSTATAEDGPPSGQIFRVDPVVDGFAALSLTGAALLLDRNKQLWSGVDPCRGALRRPTAADRAAFARLPPDGGLCDRAEVPRIDRWSMSLKSPTADAIADTLLLSFVAAPLLFSGIDTAAAGITAARLGDDAAVTFQAFGATYLATIALKMAVARPRPLTYNPRFDKAVRFAGSSRLSFPSGHAAISFSGASILSVMLAERFGDDPGAVAGIVAAYAAAIGVAVARVVGGKHFLTDVVAGAALGTALGLTIPLLHTKTRQTDDRGPASPPPVIGFGGAF